MTSTKIMKSFATNAGITQKDAKAYLEALEKTIVDALNAGESFKVTDLNLSLKNVPAHDGRNPSTGEAIHIPAMRKPKFIAGTYFKEIVNAKSDK